MHGWSWGVTAAADDNNVMVQVSLFSENSSRWIVADQGVMMLGAADAVSNKRGGHQVPWKGLGWELLDPV